MNKTAVKPEEISPTPANSVLLNSGNTTEVDTADVVYYQSIKGYYVAPKQSGNYPGVVMVHEWWGLNDNIKSMAETLAKEGYQVLAVDLYNGKVATTAAEAQAYVGTVRANESIANLEAAVKFLKTKKATKIATLGWCFGGGQALQLSLNTQLDATILYYGTPLVTDKSKLAIIKWPVLGIFGDRDQAIPVDQVKAFESSLNDLKIKNSITIYPGVGHAFANPSNQGYAPTETKDAWAKTLNFLKDTLKSS